MSNQLKKVPGAGTTERQQDWSLKSLTREFVKNEFHLSRRKAAWLVQEVDRIIRSAWAYEIEEEVVEWAPRELVQALEMPMYGISQDGFWFECAAYITDELAPRNTESEYGYENRRQEMWDACDEAALL